MIMALLSLPGRWFPARQCRGLRSEALTKPVSLGPWHAPHPHLVGKERETCESHRVHEGRWVTRTPMLRHRISMWPGEDFMVLDQLRGARHCTTLLFVPSSSPKRSRVEASPLPYSKES